ncbi:MULTISPECIES: hypothetical protein [Pseudomonas]|uniref:Uncharacterized protein n=1 Tax=Pseudomonas nitroreducens TaxID=46680 RepID=A0A6G6J771_PSENT|nr:MULTISPECIES: hypothetical protein [Pseudomonas]MCG8911035.1 hypothetical protein [Pseudomonas sp. DP-17]QIE91179.1 hypothetical protein G5B91_33025 [Pseudomonas nitroreducens]
MGLIKIRHDNGAEEVLSAQALKTNAILSISNGRFVIAFESMSGVSILVDPESPERFVMTLPSDKQESSPTITGDISEIDGLEDVIISITKSLQSRGGEEALLH